MSGGVDSSVAAALLIEQGYEVTGLTLRMWPEKGSLEIPSRSEQDAGGVASKLGVPHHVVDVRERFARCVVGRFVSEYAQGRTPNPCVVCNPDVKFAALLDFARQEIGAESIATGHYARVERDERSGLFGLLRGVDVDKDQSYALYRLTQSRLGALTLPLGYYTKNEVRGMAVNLGLDVADREESQDICFVPDGSYRDFLKERAPELVRPGDIVDTRGRRLGGHEGIAFYTVGQRRGLGIPAGHRLYVVRLDADANLVVVGEADELIAKSLCIRDLSMVSGRKLSDAIVVSAKIRYNTQDSPARVVPLGEDSAILEFENAQRAVTPGQSAVFYSGDELLGGGIIDQATSPETTDADNSAYGNDGPDGRGPDSPQHRGNGLL